MDCAINRFLSVCALIVCGIAPLAAADAPKVIETVPKADARNVNPATREIRVVFSTDMDRGGMSIVGGGPKYPKITGKPRWSDNRTLLIPVRLEPDHEYRLSINSNMFQNFRSAAGEAVVPYPLSFKTATGNGKEKPATTPAGPPRVIKCEPKDGAKGVDPSTRQIRFTFDQPMDVTAGYSIVGGGPQFPQIVGRPRWADDRTLVMNVRLQPGHEYRLGVNSQTFTNTRGKDGSPAVPFPLSFTTGKGATTRPAGGAGASNLRPEDNREAIAELRRAIDEDYSYRDLRHVDWDRQFAQYSRELESATTPLQFAQTVGHLLEPAEDLHLSVEAQGQVGGAWKGTVPPANFNLKLLPRIVPGWTEHGKLVASGRFAGGETYVLIRLWDPSHEEDLRAARDAIGRADPAKGLILDVRPNGGGDEPMAARFAGGFVDAPHVYAKDEIRHDGTFSGPYDRVVEPNTDGPRYRGKIAVLMGPRCVSSNESFLLMMKTVPNCKLIGARSRGASGRPQPVDLGNGVAVNLSSWRDELPDGTCFEGVGIAPDIEVRAAASDFAARDPVIDAALRCLHQD